MKILALVMAFFAVGTGGFLSYGAAHYEERIAPKTYVGVVEVGGLKPEDAAKKIRLWWQTERVRKLIFLTSADSTPVAAMSLTEAGVNVDDQASIKDLPMRDYWEETKDKFIKPEDVVKKFDLKLTFSTDSSTKKIAELLKEKIGKPKPAKVSYDGAIHLTPETSSTQVKVDQLSSAIQAAVTNAEEKVIIPIEEAPKHIPDEELKKITAVIGEYTTKFPAHQISRNTNIRLAASKINGKVLLPGEQISFNQTVGRRTLAAGFKEAPVIINGMHDTGIGGGICQVSTTLYNASLLANLKVVNRHNHTFPSVYVPVGRDATVDWGSLDLVLQNNTDGPIAVVSESGKSTVTFRVLGQPTPGQQVKIVTKNHKTWANGQKIVVDKSLKPGAKKVVDKGGSGHSISTYRQVYFNGVLQKEELLNSSNYKGGKRIIAVAPGAPATPASKPGLPTAKPVTAPVGLPTTRA